MPADPESEAIERRDFLRRTLAGVSALALAGVAGAAARRSAQQPTVWQIDPARCTQCERCATHCVLALSAVKCIHAHVMCGYCKLCFGHFRPGANALTTAAENQMCPTGAIVREFVEEPYYEYTVEEELCNGCAKCVKGCNTFGNGSLFLQVRHDRCLDCNECAIAVACPADAFRRVPANTPYLLKGQDT